MPTVGWDETSPADGDNIGQGDDVIRSLKSSVRVGLDGEHNWPSAGGANTGVHRLGSARPYFGVQSLVSSSGSDSRLMITSDTTRLFAVGSEGTVFLGGQNVLSMGTPASSLPQRHVWIEEVGTVTGATGSDTITIPNSGFSGVPFVFVSAVTTPAGVPQRVMITTTLQSMSATQFVVISVTTLGNLASGHTLMWRSLGTRVL